jgi:hypothetical protein
LSWLRGYKKEVTESLSSVQFTAAHDKESRVQKTEVKIVCQEGQYRIPKQKIESLVYVL